MKEPKFNQCNKYNSMKNKELKMKELLNIEFSDVKISELIEKLKEFQERSNNMNISKLHLEISGFDSNGDKHTLLTVHIGEML